MALQERALRLFHLCPSRCICINHFAFETLIRPLLLPAKAIPDNGKQRNNITPYSGLSQTSSVFWVNDKYSNLTSSKAIPHLFTKRSIWHPDLYQTHGMCNDMNLNQTDTQMCGWMLRSWGRLLCRETVFVHVFDHMKRWSANFKRAEIWTQTQLWPSGEKKMIKAN